jgi:hypothetical protein
MDKITSTVAVVTVCFILVAGAAASYPSWPQWEGQLQNFGNVPQDNSTLPSNSTTTQAPPAPSDAGSQAAPTVFTATLNVANTTTAVPFGPAWVSQFVGTVNSDRQGGTLTDCPALDAFAMSRFQTMTTGKNWEVTHYDYDQDLQKTFGGTEGSYSEDYFFPTEPYLKTPAGFVELVQTTDPGHWGDLTNPAYRYYGAYYEGTGPILLFQASCAPGEFTAGINQTATYAGCPHQQVTGNWLVMELSNVCEK